MSAQRDLRQLYDQWRALSLLEAEAIQACDWRRLAGHQGEKERLRQTILEASNRPASRTMEDSGAKHDLREIISKLIEMELENQRALAEQQRRLEGEHAQLQEAVNNLRQLSRAYASEAQPAWQSYS
jgi:hypothetical protein